MNISEQARKAWIEKDQKSRESKADKRRNARAYHPQSAKLLNYLFMLKRDNGKELDYTDESRLRTLTSPETIYEHGYKYCKNTIDEIWAEITAPGYEPKKDETEYWESPVIKKAISGSRNA